MPPPCESNDLLPDRSTESNDLEYWGLSNVRTGSKGCGDNADEGIEDTEDTANDAPANDLATFLSCHGKTAEEIEGDGIERLDLKYDYEIHTDDGVDVEGSVDAFEVDLLRAVAEEYGLLSCFYGRRSLRGGRKLDTSDVIGVGSYPRDAFDFVHNECVVDVDFDSPNCQPINGFMTAWVSENERRRLADDDLYAFIETYSNTYSTEEEVLGIRYIGTREATVTVVEEATVTDNGYRDEFISTSGMSPGAIAGIIVASLLALFALLALVVKKAKDRKKKEEAQMREMSIVDRALFMVDVDDEDYNMKPVSDETSVQTEDHTYDDTLGPSKTFESEDTGYEVKPRQ